MSHSAGINKLVISEKVFTMDEIQNRVFTGLPEIIKLADKYQKIVKKHIYNLNNIQGNPE